MGKSWREGGENIRKPQRGGVRDIVVPSFPDQSVEENLSAQNVWQKAVESLQNKGQENVVTPQVLDEVESQAGMSDSSIQDTGRRDEIKELSLVEHNERKELARAAVRMFNEVRLLKEAIEVHEKEQPTPDFTIDGYTEFKGRYEQLKDQLKLIEWSSSQNEEVTDAVIDEVRHLYDALREAHARIEQSGLARGIELAEEQTEHVTSVLENVNTQTEFGSVKQGTYSSTTPIRRLSVLPGATETAVEKSTIKVGKEYLIRRNNEWTKVRVIGQATEELGGGYVVSYEVNGKAILRNFVKAEDLQPIEGVYNVENSDTPLREGSLPVTAELAVSELDPKVELVQTPSGTLQEQVELILQERPQLSKEQYTELIEPLLQSALREAGYTNEQIEKSFALTYPPSPLRVDDVRLRVQNIETMIAKRKQETVKATQPPTIERVPKPVTSTGVLPGVQPVNKVKRDEGRYDKYKERIDYFDGSQEEYNERDRSIRGGDSQEEMVNDKAISQPAEQVVDTTAHVPTPDTLTTPDATKNETPSAELDFSDDLFIKNIRSEYEHLVALADEQGRNPFTPSPLNIAIISLGRAIRVYEERLVTTDKTSVESVITEPESDRLREELLALQSLISEQSERAEVESGASATSADEQASPQTDTDKAEPPPSESIQKGDERTAEKFLEGDVDDTENIEAASPDTRVLKKNEGDYRPKTAERIALDEAHKEFSSAKKAYFSQEFLAQKKELAQLEAELKKPAHSERAKDEMRGRRDALFTVTEQITYRYKEAKQPYAEALQAYLTKKETKGGTSLSPEQAKAMVGGRFLGKTKAERYRATGVAEETSYKSYREQELALREAILSFEQKRTFTNMKEKFNNLNPKVKVAIAGAALGASAWNVGPFAVLAGLLAGVGTRIVVKKGGNAGIDALRNQGRNSKLSIFDASNLTEIEASLDTGEARERVAKKGVTVLATAGGIGAAIATGVEARDSAVETSLNDAVSNAFESLKARFAGEGVASVGVDSTVVVPTAPPSTEGLNAVPDEIIVPDSQKPIIITLEPGQPGYVEPSEVAGSGNTTIVAEGVETVAPSESIVTDGPTQAEEVVAPTPEAEAMTSVTPTEASAPLSENLTSSAEVVRDPLTLTSAERLAGPSHIHHIPDPSQISPDAPVFEKANTVSDILFERWKVGQFDHLGWVPEYGSMSETDFLRVMYDAIHNVDQNTLEAMHITSGDIDTVYPGQDLNLVPILDQMFPPESVSLSGVTPLETVSLPAEPVLEGGNTSLDSTPIDESLQPEAVIRDVSSRSGVFSDGSYDTLVQEARQRVINTLSEEDALTLPAEVLEHRVTSEVAKEILADFLNVDGHHSEAVERILTMPIKEIGALPALPEGVDMNMAETFVKYAFAQKDVLSAEILASMDTVSIKNLVTALTEANALSIDPGQQAFVNPVTKAIVLDFK